MKKSFLLLFAVVLNIQCFAQVGLNIESIVTTIVLKDASDSLIMNKTVQLFDPKNIKVAEGITNEYGEYKVRLNRGETYEIAFVEAGKDWSFSLTVTTDPAATFYRTQCKIDVNQGSVSTLKAGDRECRVALFLTDSAGYRLPMQKIKLLDIAGNLLGEYQVNQNAELTLTLERSMVCLVQSAIDKVAVSARFTVPEAPDAWLEVRLKKMR